MKQRIIVFFILGLSFPITILAQTITQTIKGTIVDNESNNPLIGATVVIMEYKPLLGTTTDLTGKFKIEKVPIGRYNIQISYLGYESLIVSEILVTSGKEVVINIGLKQAIKQINEITIKGYSRKDKPLNTMASISARSFSVEEARRYAGGLDDPARLASAFAGVTFGNLQDNGIIVRGNSTKGVSWRLEGVEIPNPNHFDGGTLAGSGLVTVFSSQLLANSDFYTGAFPAEYGNALAGVFDMKFRNGNSDKRESTIQFGLLGLDISSEGPFVKGKNSTYLFNYRYSTFSLMTLMHLLPKGGGIPRYQDLSFKLNFPTRKMGNFSLWGIGAIDNMVQSNEPDSTKWETDQDRINFDWNLNMGAVGLSHKLILGKQTYMNTTLAGFGILNKMDAKRLDTNMEPRPYWYFVDNSEKITFSSFINHKFSSRHTLKTGISYHNLFYNINLNGTITDNPESFQNFVKENGYSSFLEFYVQSKYNILSNLAIYPGINSIYFTLNNDYSIDPRFSVKWEIKPNHSISFGYGKHSQLEGLRIYLINRNLNGKTDYPNKNLKLSHAHHFVLGYDWLINNYLRLKIEPYYQYLYDIPGIPDSSYSFINFTQDWTFRDSLVNNSKGRNLGIDFTIERFLHNNYYYLITASIFDSKYKGDDGVWRNTRFNKGYVINFLFGKEFYLRKNRILGTNVRFNYMGGERISPVLMDKSLQEKTVYYDDTKAFTNQMPSTYNFDITVTYRTNKMNHSSVWAIQMKNALGSPMYSGYSYNYKTDKIENEKVVVILPVLSYKIEF